KDLLSVTVSSSNPEASVPYNLTVPTIQTPQVLQYTTTQPILQTYLVDNNGNIMFPILGELHLGGLTKSEAEAYIINRLKPSFKEAPIVNVRLVNYKISVLGEVQNPNTFTVANEKINIFEALALAGDMTIYGKREKVKLLREDSEGRKNIVELDLNRSDVVNSPYFYLQQNDVVYVEPNKAKARNADIGQATSLMLSGTSILISVASLIVNIVR
ncbi:MAG: polysaccharide biosynthesis/export family protein, partial [Bacteroidaceae bacterium]